MTTEEKRRHYRVDSQNLLNYACYDENDHIVKQGMGRTLNVSETGILLETHIPIDSQYEVGLTIGFEEDLINLRGKVVYTKAGKDGKFESGIQFMDIDPDTNTLLKRFITAFRARG